MPPQGTIHFVGVMSPTLASLALFCARYTRVTASDDHRDPVVAPLLEQAGVILYDMFAQTNITKQVSTIVVARYYDDRHPELVAAKQHDVRVVTEVAFMQELSEPYRRIAVLTNYDGPLIAEWLKHVWNMGHIPSTGLADGFLVSLPENPPAPQAGDWMMLPLCGCKRDAGSYEPDFLSFTADTVVIPRIAYDFPDLYSTLDDVYNAYYTFAKRVPRSGMIVGNGDYTRMKRLRIHLADRRIITYGFDRDVAWQIRSVEETESGTQFSLFHDRTLYGPFEIPCKGEIFIYAAAAVGTLSLIHDMKVETLAKGLASVPQLARYLSQSRDKEGRLIIDDRADHPETIESVLVTIRHQNPGKRIWCVYQPGSYLRSKALAADFETALALADYVYIGNIKGYPREKSEGLHSRHIVANMKQRHPQTHYFDDTEQMRALLKERVPSTDIIVTLGASGVCQDITAGLME